MHGDSIIITSSYCSVQWQYRRSKFALILNATRYNLLSFHSQSFGFSFRIGTKLKICNNLDMKQKCNNSARPPRATKQRQSTTMFKQLALRHTTQLFIQPSRLFKPVITFTSHIIIGTKSAELTDWLHRYCSTEYIEWLRYKQPQTHFNSPYSRTTCAEPEPLCFQSSIVDKNLVNARATISQWLGNTKVNKTVKS